MDQERQIRFLYPPIIVLAFFGWGLFEDRDRWKAFLCFIESLPESMKGALAALIGSGSAVLIVGFVLGTLTFIGLRLLFSLLRTHEIPISADGRLLVWQSVAGRNPLEKRQLLFASAYVHFGKCPANVADWIARRWNAFNLSANITLGVCLVMLFVDFDVIRPASLFWIKTGIGAAILFFVNGFIAWRETMGMISFCAKYHRGA